MKRFLTLKFSLIISCVIMAGFVNAASAQEFQRMSDAQWDSLLDRVFEQDRLCPEGFAHNGEYPETARCISFRGFGNCPGVAKGCVEQVMTPPKQSGLKELNVCSCPAAFSHWR